MFVSHVIMGGLQQWRRQALEAQKGRELVRHAAQQKAAERRPAGMLDLRKDGPPFQGLQAQESGKMRIGNIEHRSVLQVSWHICFHIQAKGEMVGLEEAEGTVLSYMSQHGAVFACIYLTICAVTADDCA